MLPVLGALRRHASSRGSAFGPQAGMHVPGGRTGSAALARRRKADAHDFLEYLL